MLNASSVPLYWPGDTPILHFTLQKSRQLNRKHRPNIETFHISNDFSLFKVIKHVVCAPFQLIIIKSKNKLTLLILNRCGMDPFDHQTPSIRINGLALCWVF